jgi:serine/threonine-protein kinase HipA
MTRRASLDEATITVVLPDGDEVVAGTVARDGLPTSNPRGLAFRYADDYLIDPRGYDLSPDMPRMSGIQRTWSGRDRLGALGDAMPDDWGRRIIRTATTARDDFDYLVHVNDVTRHGALRVRSGAGAYLNDQSHGVAEVHALNRVVAAARALEDGTETDDDLKILVEAGTSAGGARPKATVVRDGELWMAKFARDTEFHDPMAWEATALALAAKSGVITPAHELHRLGEGGSILFTRRFDRDLDRRIGYISAHSLTTKLERESLSYVQLVDIATQYSPDPAGDAAALFRRVALNLLIGNVDDHFRNHGFLRTPSGWALSPVFDLEPNRRPAQVEATAISEDGERYDRDIRELLECRDVFRLTHDSATKIIREVADATAGWFDIALAQGISREAASTMSGAFDGPNRDRVASL